MKNFWKIPVFFFVCSSLGPWVSATPKRRPRFPVNSNSNGGNELCPKIRIGQDDLPGFDLISQFQIDRAASRRTVQRVVGSTALQVAYKLGSNVDFRIPTRHLYPSGLPEEYSFLTTFRMTGSTLEKNWNIWQIQDSSGREQVGVKINGQAKSVAFSYKGLDGNLQTAAFSNLPSLFDSQWHKLMIGVERNSATLFIDCIRIESLPIKPRGSVDVDGFAVLGKLADNPQVSVPTLKKIFLHLMSRHTSSGWVRKLLRPLLLKFEMLKFYAAGSFNDVEWFLDNTEVLQYLCQFWTWRRDKRVLGTSSS